MAVAPEEGVVAVQAADGRHTERLERLPQQGLVPGGADLVEHDAGHPHAGVVVAVAPHHRRHRRAHGRGIDDEQYRSLEQRGHVCRRRRRVVRRPVEQSHHAFDDEHVGAAPGARRERRDRVGSTEPWVEVAGRAVARERVVAGVDEVGADLGAGGAHAAAGEGGEQPRGDGRLPDAGRHAGDDQPGPEQRRQWWWPCPP
jgi:hypothetical protein